MASKIPGISTQATQEKEFIVDNHWAGIGVTLFGDDTIHTASTPVLAGTALGKITATGLYAIYDDAAVDGREDGTGLLYKGVLAADTATGNQLVTMVIHAVVDESETTGVDAAFKVDVAGAFIWV